MAASGEVVARKERERPAVTLAGLFGGFLEIALSSFGGALAWARRVVVERRGWLSDREFAELLGLCQVLPGGNVINLAVLFGAQTRGPLGALAALAGLLLTPFLLILLLGVLYTQSAPLEAVRAALRGAAAVTVGLLLATGLKLARPYRRQPSALVMIALAFVGVGVLRLPMVPVLLLLAPCSIALAWRRRR